jgi:hypothetical protein
MVLVHWLLLLEYISLLLQVLPGGVLILLYLHEIVLIPHDLQTGLVFLLMPLHYHLGWETLVFLAQ